MLITDLQYQLCWCRRDFTIKRNTAVPTKESEILSAYSTQTTSRVCSPTYEVDHACRRDDNLNDFKLSSTPPAPSGVPAIASNMEKYEDEETTSRILGEEWPLVVRINLHTSTQGERLP